MCDALHIVVFTRIIFLKEGTREIGKSKEGFHMKQNINIHSAITHEKLRIEKLHIFTHITKPVVRKIFYCTLSYISRCKIPMFSYLDATLLTLKFPVCERSPHITL